MIIIHNKNCILLLPGQHYNIKFAYILYILYMRVCVFSFIMFEIIRINPKEIIIFTATLFSNK